ncbi:MAG TPA: hypothetical protein VH500_08760 [Nitrososphaeraceae archaeon]
MALDTSSPTSSEELKKMLDDLSAHIRGIHSSADIETAKSISPRYDDLFDRLNRILDRFGRDIESFVKLDIKTQITDANGKVIAVYETVYELNGNITETFPQNTDSVMLARHEELADNSIKQRNDSLVNIVKTITEILKF